jgi:hypothetical protein
MNSVVPANGRDLQFRFLGLRLSGEARVRGFWAEQPLQRRMERSRKKIGFSRRGKGFEKSRTVGHGFSRDNQGK